VGNADDLFNRPANTFVAGFIGSPPSNLVQGSLRRDGNKIAFANDQLSFEVPASALSEISVPDPPNVIAGIKPKDIELFDESGSGRNEGEVFAVEPMDDLTIVTVKVADELLKARRLGFWKPVTGQRIWFRIDSSKVLFYSADSGQRLH